MAKFPYTKEGYTLALEYIKSLGKENEIEKGFSTDGFSIVYFANSLFGELQWKLIYHTTIHKALLLMK